MLTSVSLRHLHRSQHGLKMDRAKVNKFTVTMNACLANLKTPARLYIHVQVSTSKAVLLHGHVIVGANPCRFIHCFCLG